MLNTTQLFERVVFLREILSYRKVARAQHAGATAIKVAADHFFRRQGLAFGKALANIIRFEETVKRPFLEQLDVNQIEGIFDSAVAPVDLGTLATAITKSYIGGMIFAGAEYNLGLSFDLKNPRAVAYQQSNGVELLRELNDTTKRDINALIIKGLENGTSPIAIARQIKGLFVSYGAKVKGPKHIRNRAELVAVTESAKAYSAGNYGAILEATGTGLEFEKSWLTVGDKRVDAGCKGNQDQGWIDMAENHSTGVLHPPDHLGCRCVERYQRKEATAITIPKAAPVSRARAAKVALLPTAAKPLTPPVDKQTPFDLNSDASYVRIHDQLGTLFPDTSSFWNKTIVYDKTMNPVGLYEPSIGRVTMNSLWTKAPKAVHKNAAFRAAVHELLHSRSKGTRDFNIEGLGWEEAIIEANAQIHAFDIAKKVGYPTGSEKAFTENYGKHPYTAKWIAPLDKTIKDIGLDRTTFYTEMLAKTCDERKRYIRDALVKKYGKDEGRTRFLEIARALS